MEKNLFLISMALLKCQWRKPELISAKTTAMPDVKKSWELVCGFVCARYIILIDHFGSDI